MPKYVIERTVPGVGRMNPDELQALSAKSNAVLADLDGNIQWVHSYVTQDKLFCVYNAEQPGADPRARALRRIPLRRHPPGRRHH